MLKKNSLYYRLIMLLICGGIILFLIRVHRVLFPFVTAVLLAYLFYPIENFLRKKKIPRTWVVYLLVLSFLLLIVFITFVIFPSFIKELDHLSEMVPRYMGYINDFVSHLNREYQQAYLPSFVKEVIDRTLLKIEENLIGFIESLSGVILNIVPQIFTLFISPIITYYILRDLKILKKTFLRIVPRDKRRLCLELGVEVNNIFSGFLRGQLWLSFFVGILTALTLYFFEIKFSLILGIFAGVTNIIPYVGPLIGAVPAVFIALLSSPSEALMVIVLFIIIQQLESSIISPKIISSRVGLHPITVIFALLAGADLLGIWGVIIAVPAAGSLKVIIRFLRENKYLFN